jgi:hypothetical protein
MDFKVGPIKCKQCNLEENKIPMGFVTKAIFYLNLLLSPVSTVL